MKIKKIDRENVSRKKLYYILLSYTVYTSTYAIICVMNRVQLNHNAAYACDPIR